MDKKFCFHTWFPFKYEGFIYSSLEYLNNKIDTECKQLKCSKCGEILEVDKIGVENEA